MHIYLFLLLKKTFPPTSPLNNILGEGRLGERGMGERFLRILYLCNVFFFILNLQAAWQGQFGGD